jgi:hypothetical protein
MPERKAYTIPVLFTVCSCGFLIVNKSAEMKIERIARTIKITLVTRNSERSINIKIAPIGHCKFFH